MYGPETPVPIFQHEAEFLALLDLYKERRPKRVLEVGTYYGGTLYHWLQNAKPKTRVVSIDSYAVGVDNRYQYDQWVPKGVKLSVICGDSRDSKVLVRAARLSPYDWIFIDAGHYYDEVKADWEHYKEMAGPGCVIAFHDILTSQYHPEIEVEKLWNEITPEYETREIIENRGAAWGGIGVVFMP